MLVWQDRICRLALVTVVTVCSAALMACGSDDGGGNASGGGSGGATSDAGTHGGAGGGSNDLDAGGAEGFVIPSLKSKWMYKVEGFKNNVPVTVGTPKKIGGVTYGTVSLRESGSGGFVLFVTYTNDNGLKVRIGGWEEYDGQHQDPSMVVELTTPTEFDLSAADGKKKETTGKGTWAFRGESAEPIEFHVSYTVTSDQSIKVPYGEVTGCMKVDMTVDSKEFFQDQPLHSSYYLKSGIGLIHGTAMPGTDKVELVSFTPAN